MKRLFPKILTAICLFLTAVSAASAEKPGFMFGVKPGMLIQTSYFGLSYSRLEPFVGLDWVAVSVNSEGGDVAGSVFIPHLGSRWYLKPRGAQHAIAPYFLGDVFFSLASVKVEGAASEEEDAIKDFLEFWGMTLRNSVWAANGGCASCSTKCRSTARRMNGKTIMAIRTPTARR
jgi:hypothetical protein